MEWFTADFLLAFGWATGYSPSNPGISGTFWKFPNFLRSKVLSRSATRQATRALTFW